MPSAKLARLVQHVRQLAGNRSTADAADAELLERYIACRDETAFAALVNRYGRLIGSVCRHVLRREQDVEDAVQATLLILARKADSIRKRPSIASWLYGVAYRTAMNSKKTAMRRQARERRSAPRPVQEPVSEFALHELQTILDEEVLRLPEKYRAPFVLCCLEGKSKAEAANELGWKHGTVSGRLAQAREQLQRRLRRRGVALSAALCAAGLDRHAQAVAPALVRGVLQAVAGRPDAVPAAVTALAQRVIRTLVVGKIKLLSLLVVGLSLLTAGAGVLARQSHPVKAAQPPAPAIALLGVDPAKATQPRVDRFGDPLPAGAVERLGTLRFRQGGGAVNALLLSPDGKKLVSNTFYGNRTVCVWELATGKLLHQFPGNYDETREVALSPDGKILATADEITIHFWDLDSGRQVRQLKSPLGAIEGLAFSADGKLLASGHGGQTVLLWDLTTGTVRERLPAKQNRLSVLAFTPDGQTLITGDALDRTVRFFDLATHTERRHLTRPDLVRGIALSPDGRLLALGNQNGPASIWDVKTGRLVQQFHGYPFVPGVAFSPDGKTLATAEWDTKASRQALGLWSLATGKRLRTVETHVGALWTVVFSSDGKTLVGGTGTGVIKLWDTATGSERDPARESPTYVGGVTVSPDGRTLAYTAKSALYLWDLRTGRDAGHLAGPHWPPAFSPDGRTLAAGMDFNKVDLWNVANRRLARRLESDPSTDGFAWIRYSQVAFSPDGRQLASAGTAFSAAPRGSHELIQIWDLAAGRPQRRFLIDNQGRPFCPWSIESLAWSSDGKRLATAERDGSDASHIHLWDVATGTLLRPLMTALNGSPDEGPRRSLHIFEPVPTNRPHIVFSPDGRMLAMNRWQKTIPVWETASGQLRCLLQGHEQSTTCVMFAPDGRTLASASFDNSIRLWDLETGQELRKLTGHRGAANALAFSPDGRLLISSGNDTTMLIWDVAAVTQRPQSARPPLSAADSAALWHDLIDNDAAKAYHAVTRLTAAPEQAVSLLQAHVKPATPLDQARVQTWIHQLDARRFAVREKATAELEQLGGTVAPALRRALEQQPSLEKRRRIEQLLGKLVPISGTELRLVRAVEILEHVNTSACRRLLRRLAGGAPDARLTQEASAALARLARQKP